MKQNRILLCLGSLLLLFLFSAAARAAETDPVFSTAGEAAAYIRAETVERVHEFSFRYTGEEPIDLEDVLSYEGSAPDEGDYLRLNISSFEKTQAEDGTVQCSVLYRSDASKEKSVSAAIPKIVAEAPAGVGVSAEYRKAVYIFDWICTNVQRTENSDFTAYNVIVNGQGQCQGIALTYYRLARELGLDCRILVGELDCGWRTADHAWNAVKLGGSWYMVDAWMGSIERDSADPYASFLFSLSEDSDAYLIDYASDGGDGHDDSRLLASASEIGSYAFNGLLTGTCGGAAWSFSPTQGVVAFTAAEYAAGEELHWTAFAEKTKVLVLEETADAFCADCVKNSALPLHVTDAAPSAALQKARENGVDCHTLGELAAVPATCAAPGSAAGFGCGRCAFYTAGGERIPVDTADDAHIYDGAGRCAVCGVAADILAHGYCGADVRWYITPAMELVLTGSGEMLDFPDDTFTPWYEYQSEIQSATVEDGITNVGSYAFRNCGALSDVSIGAGLLWIGNFSFGNVSSLTEIALPDSVTEIGSSAFAACSALSRVKLSENLRSIGILAFIDSGIESIRIPASVMSSRSIFKTLGPFFRSALKHIVFERGMRCIPAGICAGAWSLETVELPDTVEAILDSAFDNCRSLREIDLPDPLRQIGESSFSGCRALTELKLPQSLNFIGEEAFRATGLTFAAIPASVTRIEKSAFSGCEKLASVYLAGDETKIGSGAFPGASASTPTVIHCSEAEKSANAPSQLFSTNPLAKAHTDLDFDPASHGVKCSGEPIGGFVAYCNTCGRTVTETGIIDADLHTRVTDPAVAATCTEEGRTEGSHCAVCGEIFTAQEPVAPTGHTPAASPAVAPTCTKAGKTEGSRCAVCGEVLTGCEAVPPTGHSPVSEPGSAPTCTEPGKTEKTYCGVCGAVLVRDRAIPPTGHVDETGPEETPDGVCDVCGNPIGESEAQGQGGETETTWFSRLYQGIMQFFVNFVRLVKHFFGRV